MPRETRPSARTPRPPARQTKPSAREIREHARAPGVSAERLHPHYKVRIGMRGGAHIDTASKEEPHWKNGVLHADWVNNPKYGDTIVHIDWAEVSVVSFRYSE